MSLTKIVLMPLCHTRRSAERFSATASLLVFTLAVVIPYCCGLALAQALPKPSGYVNDFAHVLDQESSVRIEQLCQELQAKTGAELTVVTVKSLDGEPIEDYAVKLFQQWGIGKKDQSNGLLVLVAIQERRTRMEVGYGLEPVIPDGYSGEVLRSLQPYFRANQYGVGLYAAASQLASRIAQSAGVTLSTSRDTPEPGNRERPRGSSPFQLILVGGLILLALFLLPYLLGGGGGGLMGPPMGGGRYRRGGYYGGGFGGFGGGSGGFGGGGSGGFGGFGGGSSGGGGSSSGW
jgi:uncharacterized protein